MKRFLIIFLLLLVPLSFPSFVFAQTPTPSGVGTTAPAEPSWWDSFWAWVTGIFIKTDYSISERSTENIISDQNTYTNDSSKHSSQGTRLTDSNSQICYKGSVIKKVILNESGYPDSDLTHICNSGSSCAVSTDTSCDTISIKDLAVYFVQTQKPFYCDDKNNLVSIESKVVNAVNSFLNGSSAIPNENLTCYQKIYKDFYLVPKDTTDYKEENSKKIIQTPISADSQKDSGTGSDELQDNLDKNFSPQGTDAGLDGIRPANWPGSSTSESSSDTNISDTGLTAEDIQNATCSVANKVILTSQCSSINSSTNMNANGTCSSKTLCTSGCGPVSVSEILQAKSETLTPSYLMTNTNSPYYNTYTCNGGTSWATAIAAFKKYLGENSVGSVLYSCSIDDVKTMLCQGNPVMILLSWSTGGHYVVAVGISSNGELIIKDPGNGQINLYPSSSYYSVKNKTISSCLSIDANYIK